MIMCIHCNTLIKAIDVYIKKADDNLSDELEAQGYIKSEKTIKYIQETEDGVAEALLDEFKFI